MIKGSIYFRTMLTVSTAVQGPVKQRVTEADTRAVRMVESESSRARTTNWGKHMSYDSA